MTCIDITSSYHAGRSVSLPPSNEGSGSRRTKSSLQHRYEIIHSFSIFRPYDQVYAVISEHGERILSESYKTHQPPVETNDLRTLIDRRNDDGHKSNESAVIIITPRCIFKEEEEPRMFFEKLPNTPVLPKTRANLDETARRASPRSDISETLTYTRRPPQRLYAIGCPRFEPPPDPQADGTKTSAIESVDGAWYSENLFGEDDIDENRNINKKRFSSPRKISDFFYREVGEREFPETPLHDITSKKENHTNISDNGNTTTQDRASKASCHVSLNDHKRTPHLPLQYFEIKQKMNGKAAMRRTFNVLALGSSQKAKHLSDVAAFFKLAPQGNPSAPWKNINSDDLTENLQNSQNLPATRALAAASDAAAYACAQFRYANGITTWQGSHVPTAASKQENIQNTLTFADKQNFNGDISNTTEIGRQSKISIKKDIQPKISAITKEQLITEQLGTLGGKQSAHDRILNNQQTVESREQKQNSGRISQIPRIPEIQQSKASIKDTSQSINTKHLTNRGCKVIEPGQANGRDSIAAVRRALHRINEDTLAGLCGENGRRSIPFGEELLNGARYTNAGPRALDPSCAVEEEPGTEIWCLGSFGMLNYNSSEEPSGFNVGIVGNQVTERSLEINCENCPQKNSNTATYSMELGGIDHAQVNSVSAVSEPLRSTAGALEQPIKKNINTAKPSTDIIITDTKHPTCVNDNNKNMFNLVDLRLYSLQTSKKEDFTTNINEDVCWKYYSPLDLPNNNLQSAYSIYVKRKTDLQKYISPSPPPQTTRGVCIGIQTSKEISCPTPEVKPSPPREDLKDGKFQTPQHILQLTQTPEYSKQAKETQPRLITEKQKSVSSSTDREGFEGGQNACNESFTTSGVNLSPVNTAKHFRVRCSNRNSSLTEEPSTQNQYSKRLSSQSSLIRNKQQSSVESIIQTARLKCAVSYVFRQPKDQGNHVLRRVISDCYDPNSGNISQEKEKMLRSHDPDLPNKPDAPISKTHMNYREGEQNVFKNIDFQTNNFACDEATNKQKPNAVEDKPFVNEVGKTQQRKVEKMNVGKRKPSEQQLCTCNMCSVMIQANNEAFRLLGHCTTLCVNNSNNPSIYSSTCSIRENSLLEKINSLHIPKSTLSSNRKCPKCLGRKYARVRCSSYHRMLAQNKILSNLKKQNRYFIYTGKRLQSERYHCHLLQQQNARLQKVEKALSLRLPSPSHINDKQNDITSFGHKTANLKRLQSISSTNGDFIKGAQPMTPPRSHHFEQDKGIHFKITNHRVVSQNTLVSYRRWVSDLKHITCNTKWCTPDYPCGSTQPKIPCIQNRGFGLKTRLNQNIPVPSTSSISSTNLPHQQPTGKMPHSFGFDHDGIRKKPTQCSRDLDGEQIEANASAQPGSALEPINGRKINSRLLMDSQISDANSFSGINSNLEKPRSGHSILFDKIQKTSIPSKIPSQGSQNAVSINKVQNNQRPLSCPASGQIQREITGRFDSDIKLTHENANRSFKNLNTSDEISKEGLQINTRETSRLNSDLFSGNELYPVEHIQSCYRCRSVPLAYKYNTSIPVHQRLYENYRRKKVNLEFLQKAQEADYSRKYSRQISNQKSTKVESSCTSPKISKVNKTTEIVNANKSSSHNSPSPMLNGFKTKRQLAKAMLKPLDIPLHQHQKNLHPP